ncbi:MULTISPECIES: Crp/Fnr family transcriptional regulator [Kitasatospora]|uniref:CRP-like cAMP-binding protein n=2 Tax=Kitasatospora TaxID=2063 RepID=A0ABT1J892_9ACTN|nr:Crp/Fnr family transcriptional regulator [Kitasatospora paracochleata]MCP2313333.1 CRP-like cAMP-binding protein [Kitasatospora paracochleata]
MATQVGLGDRVPFLARLDEPARHELRSLGLPQSVGADTVVLHEGEPSTHVLLVLDGWLRVTASSANGHEGLLALRGPGDVVGELAAIDGQTRSARVSTMSSARLLAVRSADFRAFLERTPGAALALVAVLADRLRIADRKRLEAAAHTVPERLARLLLDLVEQHGTEQTDGIAIAIGLSQRELAGSVGASREAVARVLKELRDRGVVTTDRRRVVVRRPEVLRRIAGSVHSVTDAPRPASPRGGAERRSMGDATGARNGGLRSGRPAKPPAPTDPPALPDQTALPDPTDPTGLE